MAGGRVDGEAALDELSAWIADTKTGYGREELLQKLAQLRQRHRVPEHLLDRTFRLYGGPVAVLRHLTQLVQIEASPAVGDEAELGVGKAGDLGHPTAERSHDGSQGPAGTGPAREGRRGAPVG